MAKVKLDNLHNIEDEQFPSNSKASRKEEEPPVEAVVLEEAKPKARAIRRRKSVTRSIKQAFFNEDTKGVADHVIFEVLVPAAKTMISEMFTQAIQMMLFGDGGAPRRSSRDRDDRSFVNYGDRYRGREYDRPALRSARRDRFGLKDIYFRTAKEATDVLSDLCELLEKYDQVSVQDYFDLAGIDGATHVHAKWGWDSLKKAYCTYMPEGHTIVMPPEVELE